MNIFSLNPDVKFGAATTAQGVVNTLLKMQRTGYKYASLHGSIAGVSQPFSGEVIIEEALLKFRALQKDLTNRSTYG